jgi:hypothetical protein
MLFGPFSILTLIRVIATHSRNSHPPTESDQCKTSIPPEDITQIGKTAKTQQRGNPRKRQIRFQQQLFGVRQPNSLNLASDRSSQNLAKTDFQTATRWTRLLNNVTDAE